MSDTKKDGGPAFPTEHHDNGLYTPPEFSPHAGMSLRDYMAAKAMNGALAFNGHGSIAETAFAEWCYDMADAMLKAREQ